MEDEIGISITPTEDATQSQRSFNKLFWLHCFSLSIWIYRTIYASNLKQKVKLSFCFTVFDQVVMNEQNSNMWLKVREYKTTWLVMRDKCAAKCFKYNNDNLVLVIICLSRFVSLVLVVSVISVVSVVLFRSFRLFRWFGFGGLVSLFRVLVHAQNFAQIPFPSQFFVEIPVPKFSPRPTHPHQCFLQFFDWTI